MFLGKLRYAAPEQFGPEPVRIDQRCDLYAFGLVLYQLLTGRRAFDGGDQRQIIADHLLRAPLPFAQSDPAGRVPTALREVVTKALAKDPAQRWGSAEEFQRALDALKSS